MRISDWSSDVCSSDLLGIDTAVRFDVREARGDEACEAHLVFGTCHEAEQLLGLLLSRAVGEDHPIIDRIDVAVPSELEMAAFGTIGNDEPAGAGNPHTPFSHPKHAGNQRANRPH